MSRKKFELIAEFFRSWNLDFCFVQEPMISKESKIASLSASWRGPSFWAPAVGRRGGVVILCSQDYSDQVSVWQKDSNGRIVSLLVQCDSVKLNLVNIYAPTVPAERKVFLQTVPSFFFPDSHPLIGGDFNCFDSPLDKMGGTVSLDSNFINFKDSCGLRDAWRSLHPRVRKYTWFNSDLSIGSRLDSFLLSRLDCAKVCQCEISPCVFSDHEFVTVSFDLENLPLRGGGLWKFNNSLLDDQQFCTEMLALIEQLLAVRHVFLSYREFWEILKNDMKSLAISYSKCKRRAASHQKCF